MRRRSFIHPRHSDGITRLCSRCRKELTDSASREHGVGPVCRNKTNALHSIQIPANLNVASALFLALKKEDFSEHTDGFDAVRKLFVKRLVSLRSNNSSLDAVTLVGADFRKVVDWFDYSLSFTVKQSIRVRVIEIVEALGYVGLASVLRGDACMSPATLLVEGGVIKLSGKSCKPGFFAMKRQIPGIQVPRYRGAAQPYVASVAHAEKFVEIAFRFWPFIDCNRAEVLADAAREASKLPATSPSPSAAAVVAQISAVDSRGNFQVKTPWTGTRDEMQGMLDRFKALPKAERKYLPAVQAWSFAQCHLDTVKAIVAERYLVQVSNVAASAPWAPTPYIQSWHRY